MFNVSNFTPVSAQNINFGRKKESMQPEKPVDVIDQAYRFVNGVPEKEKFFSPGADLAFPLVFSLPYALSRTDHRLAKLTKKLAKAKEKERTKRIATLTEKVNNTDKWLKEGVNGVNIKTVSLLKPKEAFKEYGGKGMFLFYLAMEGWEVYNTLKELGQKAAIKQGFRGVANAAGSLTGWVAGSALAHKLGAKVGAAIGGAIAGPAGRFLGNLVGATIGFMGGMLGERIMRKAGEKIYGKSELDQAKAAKYKQDLKNIDLNDKLTLKQQIVKNRELLKQFVDENGQVSTHSNENLKIFNTIAEASEEMKKKFIAAGGTEEELQAAFENPEEVLSQETRNDNNNTMMYYSGAFNSATAKGDPRFNGYTQGIFA